MNFDRKRQNKAPKIKSVFTSNGKEDERMPSETKAPFHERMGIWGYTFTILGVGLGIGMGFGAFAYSLTATTDEKLIEDIKFYKEERNIAINEKDSLKHENELLLSEREALQEQLTEEQEENKSLTESINKVNEELKQYKDKELENKISSNANSTSEKQGKIDSKGKQTSEPTEINSNDSVSFFEGELNVAASSILTYSADIQIGANGYKSTIFYSKKAGSQLDYEGESKFQVRIIKINSTKESIVVQVTKY